MTPVPTVRRVLGDGPFAEIGEPALAVVDERSRMVAVGGDLGHVQWSGSGTADSRWTGQRIGVYEQNGLRCRHLVRSWYPVRSLAFHPVLPLLAVGTGCYDGGYSFEGELLLIHLDSGAVVSTLQYPREVLSVEWRSETALRLVLAPCDDWDNPQAHEQGHAVVVARPDWGAVGQGAIGPQELAARAEPVTRPDHSGEARRILADLAACAGRQWSMRRRVWAVEGTADGRVLAALDGVLAESWLPSGDLQWAVGDEEGGRQLVLASDGTSVWTNAERRRRFTAGRWETSAPRLARIAVDTGQVLETLSPNVFTVLVAGGHRTVLRPLDDRRKRPERLLVLGLDGPVDGPEVGAFDLFNHPFAVRRASRPYVLVGTDPDEPHRDKWVAALDTDGALRRLFAHSWVPQEHHFGGPAVEIGQSLVCAGAVHHGQGLQPGGAYIVRRSLNGAVQWQHRADHPATALDADGDTVYVAYNSGALTALDAEGGSVRWRTDLQVEGVPTIALSLALAPQGHHAVGPPELARLPLVLPPCELPTSTFTPGPAPHQSAGKHRRHPTPSQTGTCAGSGNAAGQCRNGRQDAPGISCPAAGPNLLRANTAGPTLRSGRNSRSTSISAGWGSDPADPLTAPRTPTSRLRPLSDAEYRPEGAAPSGRTGRRAPRPPQACPQGARLAGRMQDRAAGPMESPYDGSPDHWWRIQPFTASCSSGRRPRPRVRWSTTVAW